MDEAVNRFLAEVNVGTYVTDDESFCTIVDYAYKAQNSVTFAVAMKIYLVYALCHDSNEFFGKANEYLQGTLSEATLESVQSLMIMVSPPLIMTRMERLMTIP